MRNGSTNKIGAKTRRDEGPVSVEPGSGNVFADLGLPNPHIALAKAQLVQRIRRLISEHELTQSQAARLLGIDEPKVSRLIRGQVDGYTIDRLFRFLTALGQRIVITVQPATKHNAGAMGEPSVAVS